MKPELVLFAIRDVVIRTCCRSQFVRYFCGFIGYHNFYYLLSDNYQEDRYAFE